MCMHQEKNIFASEGWSSPASGTRPCGERPSGLPVRHHPSHNSVHEPLGNRAILLFVTVVAEHRTPLFKNPAAIEAVLRAWNDAQNWHVGRYVFMPDHIHFFCAPGLWPTPDFYQWMRYWKRLATQCIAESGGRPSPAANAAREDARPPMKTRKREHANEH